MTILKELRLQEIGCPATEESPVIGGENVSLAKIPVCWKMRVNTCHCLHWCHLNQVSEYLMWVCYFGFRWARGQFVNFHKWPVLEHGLWVLSSVQSILCLWIEETMIIQRFMWGLCIWFLSLLVSALRCQFSLTVTICVAKEWVGSTWGSGSVLPVFLLSCWGLNLVIYSDISSSRSCPFC